jgi:methionyl-tRNA formyltransferase
VDIGPDDDISIVMERVTEAYVELLEENTPALLTGTAVMRAQEESEATYCCKRVAEDNRIDWHRSTSVVYNLIRAVTSPYPGAYTEWNGELLRIWAARPLASPHRYVGRSPGRVVEVRPGCGVVVLTGDGELLVSEVQLGDGPRACAADLLNRLSITLGG